MKSVLVIGGAHVDRKGKMLASYQRGSSIPGQMIEQIGGSAFNIAVNLARLSKPIIFISARCDEALGQKIATMFGDLNVLVDRPVKVSGRAPSYTALLDDRGDLIAALADMNLYDALETDVFLNDMVQEQIKQSDMLITDGNLPSDILLAISHLKPSPCEWIAVATSPAKIVRYEAVLKDLTLLSMNMNEARQLAGQPLKQASDCHSALLAKGLSSAIITDGGSELLYYDADDKLAVTPPLLRNILDVTGAGDAFLSGFVSARLDGKGARAALNDALAASYITLQSDQAQSQALSLEKLTDIAQILFKKDTPL